MSDEISLESALSGTWREATLNEGASARRSFRKLDVALPVGLPHAHLGPYSIISASAGDCTGGLKAHHLKTVGLNQAEGAKGARP
jgi:hypothetical protein